MHPLARMITKGSTWASVINFKSSPFAKGWQNRVTQSIQWVLCFLCCLPPMSCATEYLTRDEFLQDAFDDSVPPPQTAWLRGELREGVKHILGHRYSSLRIRFWRIDTTQPRTAWILKEIGKELPITVGVVVDNGVIESVQVLEFRESRGGEVRYPAFTRQFESMTLTDQFQLSGNIDGISGATLSVSALKRLCRLALYLHDYATAIE